jgi:hypothetical protein
MHCFQAQLKVGRNNIAPQGLQIWGVRKSSAQGLTVRRCEAQHAKVRYALVQTLHCAQQATAQRVVCGNRVIALFGYTAAHAHRNFISTISKSAPNSVVDAVGFRAGFVVATVLWAA